MTTHSDYVDQVHVTLRPASDMATVVMDESVEFDFPVTTDADVHAELREALYEAGVTDRIIFETTRREVSWGADAVFLDVAVAVAVDLFKQAAMWFVAYAKPRLSHDPEPMTEAEAEAWARQRLATRYDVEANALRLVSVQSETVAHEFAFIAPDGQRLELRLLGSGPGASVEWYRRFPGDGSEA